MAVERNVMEIIAPELQKLPAEQMPGNLANEILKDDMLTIEAFSEEEEAKLIQAMETYTLESRTDNLRFKRYKVQALATIAALTDTRFRRPGDFEETFDTLTKSKFSIESLGDESNDLMKIAALMVETDRVLRTSGVGEVNLREEIAGLSAADLAAYAIVPEGTDQAGGINFQDPERAKRDMIDAIDKFREENHRTSVVYIPEEYYQEESLRPDHHIPIENHTDIFIEGTRVVKPEKLKRVPKAEREGVSNVIRMRKVGDWELTPDLVPEMHRVVNRFQVLGTIQRFMNGDGGLQQYLRPMMAFFKAEGIDVDWTVKNLAQAEHKAIEFLDMTSKTTSDKDLSEIKRAMLSPTEMAMLLIADRGVIVVDAQNEAGASVTVATEIGAAQVIDTYWGEYGRWKEDDRGLPLYKNPVTGVEGIYSSFLPEQRHFLIPDYVVSMKKDDYGEQIYRNPTNGLEGIESDFPDSDRHLLIPVTEDKDNPLRPGRTVHVQQLFTEGPSKRAAQGADEWYVRIKDDLVRQLEAKGFVWKNVKGIRGLVMDNGKPMLINNPRVQRRIEELGRNPVAGPDYLLQSAIFDCHDQEMGAALGLAILIQRARQGDRMLAADYIPETEITTAMRPQHTAKYQLAPPDMIKMVRQYHKEYEFWKKDQFDAWMIGLKNIKGFRASWRNPLNPERSPIIKPILYRGDLTLPNENNIQISQAGLPVADVLKKLDSMEKSLLKEKKVLPDSLKKELQSLELGFTLIEAVLYGKESWGTDDTYQNYANAIVTFAKNAMEAGKPNYRGSYEGKSINEWKKQTRIAAKAALKQYIETYPNLAPSAARRGQQEIMPMLMAIAEDENMSSWLDNFDFEEFMVSIGEDQVAAHETPWGLQALMLSIRNRSTKTIGLGEVDKPEKYGEKYPSMASDYGKAMLNLIPALNNAVNSAYQRMLGAKKDQFEAFVPDKMTEAAYKEFLNFLTFNLRSESDAGKYVEEIIEATIKPAQGTGHLSRLEGENALLNAVELIRLMSNGVIKSNLVYQIDTQGRKGILGSHRAGVKTLAFDKNDGFATEWLRKAGFGTNYPDEQTQKPAYVSFGEMPMNEAKVSYDGKTVVPIERNVEGLAAFGHRGAESLTIILLLMAAKDKLLLTRYAVDDVLSKSGMSKEHVQMVRDIFNQVESADEKLQQVTLDQDREQATDSV